MGVRYQKRERYARVRPDNIYIAYAVAVAGGKDKVDDPEPIIKDLWDKAEANREKTLKLLDYRSEL